MYSKQYICNQCDKVSTKMSNHLRHQTKCDRTVECSYPGGMYTNFETCQHDFREGFDQVEELDSEEDTS